MPSNVHENVPGFHGIISKLSSEQRRGLAKFFEIAVSTVDRWASGVANPHPLLQKKAVNWVTQHLSN